jgi:hypothetical protein
MENKTHIQQNQNQIQIQPNPLSTVAFSSPNQKPDSTKNTQKTKPRCRRDRRLLARLCQVQGGSQSPRFCQLLIFPTCLDRVLLAHNASRFVPDVARREMDVVVVRPKEAAECEGGDSKEERDKRMWVF